MAGQGFGERDNAMTCCDGGPCMAREGCVNPLVAKGIGRIKQYTTPDHETFSYKVDTCECGPATRAEGVCECGALGEPEYRGGKGHPEYRKVLAERLDLHIEKSSGYGNGSDPFANFTAVASLTGQPRYLYPVHRTIEKLTRVLSLHAQGRTWDLEEEFKDCASLLDCATALLREDTTKKSLELVRQCRHIYEVDGCPTCR